MRTRQKLFVEEYLRCWNASEAARRAGYSPRSAASIGWENLRKPEIRAEIERRIEQEVMSVNETLIRLAQQARAEYAEFIRSDGSLDLAGLQAQGKGHLIKSIKYTRYGIQVEFYNAQNALLQVARYHGLFKDKAETHTAVTFTREEVEEAHRLLAEFGAEMRQETDQAAQETPQNDGRTEPGTGEERL
jgi:phage terminase small subunit